MSNIIRSQGNQDILVKVPFSELEREVQNQIYDVVSQKPTVNILADQASEHDWRLEVNVQISSYSEEDQDCIMTELGYTENGSYNNGDILMKKVFEEVKDTNLVGISGVLEQNGKKYLLLHMPLKDYENVMSN